MRLTYPRSFLSLLLIGFTIVAAPLLFALFSNAVAFERLAGLSEKAVQSAGKVTQGTRSLVTAITSRERSARQSAVAGDAKFFEAYSANRTAFQAVIRQLQVMALSDVQRAEALAIQRQEDAIHQSIVAAGPTPQLANRLARDFALLSD